MFSYASVQNLSWYSSGEHAGYNQVSIFDDDILKRNDDGILHVWPPLG